MERRNRLFLHAAFWGLAGLTAATQYQPEAQQIKLTPYLVKGETISLKDQPSEGYVLSFTGNMETKTAPPPPTQLAQLTPLQEYLNSIQDEKDNFTTIIARQNELFKNIKNLSQYQVLEDFNLYFPIYRAAEIKFGIPWSLLWVIHVHETTASRDNSPEGSGHKGAMQLSAIHLEKEVILSAPAGWEFLDDLDQRYSKKIGWKTNDWEDILRGAAFIRLMTDWPDNDEAGILDTIKYRYSAWEHGLARVNKYHQLKAILGNPLIF